MPPKKTTTKTLIQAHILRHHTTEVEARLWSYLRANRLKNVHFRRQHAIGKYIADFCAPAHKLIVELDGSQHLDHEIQDGERTSFLTSKGYRILRFWNYEISNNLDGVLIAIEQALSEEDEKK